MPNQYTKKTAVADANLAHVLPGPSNEELDRMQEALDAARKAAGYPKVEVTRDNTARRPETGEGLDKVMEAWEDPNFDPLGLTDPMQALKKRFQRPGMALKLLSDSVCNHLGTRSYRRIIDPDTGDVVRMGKLTLGEIPEHFAAARRKQPILEAAEQIGQIEAMQTELVAKASREVGGSGLSAVRAGDTVENHGDGQTYDMGIMVQRDERPEG